jgi:hypothetical protein
MRDYYKDGFDLGYKGSNSNYEGDYPRNDGDNYSYRRGIEEGVSRRHISEELGREGY